MLRKSFIHFSGMLLIAIAILVVEVNSQRISRKSPPALHSKLRQGWQNAASNLTEYSSQSHLLYHAALKHLFLAPTCLQA